MTPKDLYQRPPESITNEIMCLRGFYYNHIPEISEFQLPWEDPNKRIAIHYYKNYSFDGRRYWALAGVYFDGVPVMIIQNAGREGDDHAKRFVTNADSYQKMLVYLNSLNPLKGEVELVNVDQDIPGLDEFYGYKLDGCFDRWIR